MKRAPTTRFKAGNSEIIYNNVNYARSEAERQANKTGEPVHVYQLLNGCVMMTVQIMKPQKDPS